MRSLTRTIATGVLLATAATSREPWRGNMDTTTLVHRVQGNVAKILESDGDKTWRIPMSITTGPDGDTLTFEKRLTQDEQELLRRDPNAFAWEVFLSGSDFGALYDVASVSCSSVPGSKKCRIALHLQRTHDREQRQ